jgi:hypothetical protein
MILVKKSLVYLIKGFSDAFTLDIRANPYRNMSYHYSLVLLASCAGGS